MKLAADGGTLIADVSKERVKRFPGFAKGEFERLDPNALAQLDATLANACVSEANKGSTLASTIACRTGGRALWSHDGTPEARHD